MKTKEECKSPHFDLQYRQSDVLPIFPNLYCLSMFLSLRGCISAILIVTPQWLTTQRRPSYLPVYIFSTSLSTQMSLILFFFCCTVCLRTYIMSD